MGVTGLWTVVAPTARPTQLASLNRKRLAVDASIWIYQFLKAVRDKEGNALRNSHVIGFFRRICKLLYHGILPVFVFDGGAPILKRETVRSRARRREGRREDAARTAGKLLAVQVARAAEEEEKRRKADRERTPMEEELPGDQELVYVDELGMTQKERQAGRGFKRKDQYHLPDLDISIESMGAPNDPRIMSQAELEEYARQFHRGEDINLYDFSKIDFEGSFFLSLPPGDRYNILNAARLRSRLRMGYSKEQLDGMFPDRMAFSRFQIERVKERNELTQRLMKLGGPEEYSLDQGGRIAGEKGKEYVLVKNDGVEGGWALGVVSNREGAKKENAIDLEEEDKSETDFAQSEEEEDFEDVEIEGLNRIPKVWQKKRKEVDYDTRYEDAVDQIARKRKAIYEGRAESARVRPARPVAEPRPSNDDRDAMFVRQDEASDAEMDDLFEDVNLDDPAQEEEDDELQRAIAMSLQPHSSPAPEAGGFFQEDVSHSNEEETDLQAALAESRKSKYQSITGVQERSLPASKPRFDGPLPFESLSLGQSLLGKKKLKKVDEGLSGGFDKDLGDDAFRKERPAQPMPSWFDAAPKTNDLVHKPVDEDEGSSDDHITYGREDVDRRETLRRKGTREVIDLDAELAAKEVVELDESDEDEISQPQQEVDQAYLPKADQLTAAQAVIDEAEAARKEKEELERNERYRLAQEIADENAEMEASSIDALADHARESPPELLATDQQKQNVTDDEDMVDWSESEVESPRRAMSELPVGDVRAGGAHRASSAEPERMADGNAVDEADFSEDEFEDVPSPQSPMRQALSHQETTFDAESAMTSNLLIPDADEGIRAQNGNVDHSDLTGQNDDTYLSDSEEEIMRQLAIEADEHARFASSLNNKTPAEAARDYENELKQLRNQQKKDRRDADEVTQVMVQECQALLRLFGLPYITAPMEAEAQCAELVHLGLVDGIVTDDSDIFLFGGTRVYKNMFNAAKFVECYLAADLEKEYALDRRKLIRFAHLLGSDYTEGIPGVGPVSALEILTEFPTLQEFKEWCGKVQLGRAQDLEDQLTTPFRRKFRNTVQKRLFLPPGFPDLRVDQAYLKPEVDSDPQEFQWGVPDLDKLRSFLMATIGWSQERTDEILVPVIRDINKRGLEGTQANITRFFAGGVGIGAASTAAEGSAARNRTGKESGRMANAFKRLKGEAERKRRREDPTVEARSAPSEDTSEGANAGGTIGFEPEKRKRAAKKRQPVRSPEGDVQEEGDDEGDYRLKKAPKKKRTRKAASIDA